MRCGVKKQVERLNRESYARANCFQPAVALRTRLRRSLKHGDTPLAEFFSLRDSDGELVHAVSRQGVDHQSPLGAFLVLPAGWLTFLPEPDCVWPKCRISQNVFFSSNISFSVFVTLELLQVHFRKAHLDAPGATFPISTAGSTQEIRTLFGDMTLTLMSRASYSGGSGRHTYEKS